MKGILRRTVDDEKWNAVKIRILTASVIGIAIALAVGIIVAAVVLNKKLTHDRQMSNARAGMIEDELLQLFVTSNMTQVVESSGTFVLEFINDLIPSNYNLMQGTYRVLRTEVNDAIDVRTLAITFPQEMMLLVPSEIPTVLDIYTYSYTPEVIHYFTTRAFADDRAYIMLNNTGALALGFPCVLNNTCTITPNAGDTFGFSSGPMFNTPNLLFMYYPSLEFSFRVTPWSAISGTIWEPQGELKINLGFVFKTPT